MSDVTKNRIVSKKDLTWAYWRWLLCIEVINSYERFQAIGLTWSIGPIMRKLYPNDNTKYAEGLTRHCLPLYNCQAIWGASILGIVVAMEEEKAMGANISDAAILGIKTGLMGPLAGIGDTVDWATLRTLINTMACVVGANGNPFSILVMFLFPLVTFFEGLYFTRIGYNVGAAAISRMLAQGIVNELIEGASVLGLFMMGALSAQMVRLSTPLKFSQEGLTLDIQSQVLDQIIPGMLQLAVVMALYAYFRKGKRNFTAIVLVLLAIGLVGSFFGIL